MRRHPDFLQRHPELMDVLDVPASYQGNGVVDLRHELLKRLRAEVSDLTSSRDSLLATGRSNLMTQNRVHQAVLAMLEAHSFERFIETITTDMAIILDIDMVTVCVEISAEALAAKSIDGISPLEPGQIEQIFGPSGHVCLRSDIAGDPVIFGEGAGLIRSDALIRLNISPEAPQAVLALGSRDPDHYHSSQGTELMSFLARVLECGCRKWLGMPSP